MTSTTEQNTASIVTLACVARVHSQATSYTDVRVAQLHGRVNAMQAQLHKQAEIRERKRLRLKLIDRLVFLLIGSLAGVLIGHMVLPAVAVFILGICPDVVKELFEFFKRL